MMGNKKIIFLVLLLLSPTFLLSQIVKGSVYNNGKPLTEVNITVINTNEGTTTNENGSFSIKANIGDFLVLSYIGMNTIKHEILDENPISFEMILAYNELDEVVVKAKAESSKYENETITSIFGKETKESRGYSVSHVEGSALNLAAPESGGVPQIANALNGKVANYKITTQGVILRSNNSMGLSNVALWEVDGVTYDGYPPPIDLTLIKDINVVRGLAGTTRYGTRGAGGVIIVTTKNYSSLLTKPKNEYVNRKYYESDAVPYSSLKNENKIYHPDNEEDFYESVKVLDDDINSLRGLAYRCQSLGDQLRAAQLYRKILSLSPNDGQSHRDLAQTWVTMNKPLKAWSGYMFWLKEVKKNINEGLDEVIFHELERLYVVEELEKEVSESFELQTNFSDLDNIMTRLVFEWSDIEHELEIEIVNPKRQSFKMEFGPLFGTKQRVKEFFLDKTIKGTWLFNISPNVAIDKPLHLKVATQLNWNSKKKSVPNVKVFTFFSENISKYQIFKIKI